MRRIQSIILICFIFSLRLVAIGEVIELPEPYLDRWTYPNNATPGSRGMASVFANSENWDRMGQFVLGFDTSELIPTKIGADNYQIESIVITLITSGEPSFQYDSTYDLFSTYLSEDPDPGRPIELHGAGFRENYKGNDFLSRNTPAFSGGLRTVYPLSWDENGEEIDMSGNVGLEVESDPWSVGRISGPDEGAYINEETEVIFDLDLSNDRVSQYLREGLDSGLLHFILSSLHTANHQGGFVNFFTRDSPEEEFFGGYAPRIKIEYSVNGDLSKDDDSFAIRSMQIGGGKVILSWDQVTGSEYVVQSSEDGTDWVNVRSEKASSDQRGSFSFSMDQRRKFYRVEKKSE